MLAAAIAVHLDSLGIVTYRPAGPGGDCFIEHLPSEPDEAVAIWGTGGFAQGARLPYDMPTVQIRTRGPRWDPVPSVQRQEAIYSALTCLDGVTLDPGGDHETRIVSLTAMQSAPVALGQDDNQRPEHTLNYRAHVHAPTTHRPAITP